MKAGTNDRRLAEGPDRSWIYHGRELLDVLGRGMGLEVIDLEFFISMSAPWRNSQAAGLKIYGYGRIHGGSGLTVATADPLDLYALEDIRLVTNMRIQLILAERTQIRHAIELNYSGIDARAAARLTGQRARRIFQNLCGKPDGKSDEDQAPIVRLLNSLLLKGYNTNASDIHIEPYENETVVRMRRDGMLIPYMTLSPAIHQGDRGAHQDSGENGHCRETEIAGRSLQNHTGRQGDERQSILRSYRLW